MKQRQFRCGETVWPPFEFETTKLQSLKLQTELVKRLVLQCLRTTADNFTFEQDSLLWVESYRIPCYGQSLTVESMAEKLVGTLWEIPSRLELCNYGVSELRGGQTVALGPPYEFETSKLQSLKLQTELGRDQYYSVCEQQHLILLLSRIPCYGQSPIGFPVTGRVLLWRVWLKNQQEHCGKFLVGSSSAIMGSQN